MNKLEDELELVDVCDWKENESVLILVSQENYKIHFENRSTLSNFYAILSDESSKQFSKCMADCDSCRPCPNFRQIHTTSLYQDSIGKLNGLLRKYDMGMKLSENNDLGNDVYIIE